MKLLLNGEILVSDLKIAKTFFQKLRGKFLRKGAILLENCNAIHTLFMRKKIDVIFLDKENKVIKIYENLSPRCIIFPIFGAKNAIEFDADFLKNAKIKVGDKLAIEE